MVFVVFAVIASWFLIVFNNLDSVSFGDLDFKKTCLQIPRTCCLFLVRGRVESKSLFFQEMPLCEAQTMATPSCSLGMVGNVVFSQLKSYKLLVLANHDLAELGLFSLHMWNYLLSRRIPTCRKELPSLIMPLWKVLPSQWLFEGGLFEFLLLFSDRVRLNHGNQKSWKLVRGEVPTN